VRLPPEHILRSLFFTIFITFFNIFRHYSKPESDDSNKETYLRLLKFIVTEIGWFLNSIWRPPATLRALKHTNIVAHHPRRSALNSFTCCQNSVYQIPFSFHCDLLKETVEVTPKRRSRERPWQVTAVTKKRSHTPFSTNPTITKCCVWMISYITRKMGGDTIMLALHTQVIYFSVSVPTSISVWKRCCRPHAPYFRLLSFEPPQTPKYL